MMKGMIIMTIKDMTNLYIGYNRKEDFSILICAPSENSAKEVAEEYRIDSNMSGCFKVTKYEGEDIHFDCDYIIIHNDDANNWINMDKAKGLFRSNDKLLEFVIIRILEVASDNIDMEQQWNNMDADQLGALYSTYKRCRDGEGTMADWMELIGMM